MLNQIKVNLRSLNLRDDIFQARYLNNTIQGTQVEQNHIGGNIKIIWQNDKKPSRQVNLSTLISKTDRGFWAETHQQ